MSLPPVMTAASVTGALLSSSGMNNLGEVLVAAARSNSGLIWLDEDGVEHNRSYAALLDDCRHVLDGLHRAGLVQGDRVLLPVDRIGDTLAILWACFLGGIVAVPMAPPAVIEDGVLPLQKLHGVWTLLGQPLVVTDSTRLSALSAYADKAGWAGFRILATTDLRSGNAVQDFPAVAPGDPAMLSLTSGSTGLSKAAILTHANALAMVAGTIQANGFTAADVTLNWMPLDHPGANVFLGVMPAILGSWQIHVPTAHILTDPLRWLALIDRHRASVSWAPNFAFSLIGRSADRLAAMRLDLSCMSFLVSAGEQVAASTSATALELLERHGLPTDALRPAFGMAECCSGITWSRGLTRRELAGNPVNISLGPPIPGAAIRVTDDEGEILPEGEIGHLELRGPSVTQGYFDNPKANGEALKPDGWFATGDLALITGGELYITGRKKQIIIVNGLNVPAHDIEAAAEEVEGVAASFTAAFSVRDPAGEAEELVVLFSHTNPATPPEGLDALGRRLRAHLIRRTGLAPAHLVAVPADAVPKTSIGKIQRLELKRRFERGDFRTHRLDLSSSQPTPRKGSGHGNARTSAQITEIWTSVLGLSEIGADENFFELGGHSILLIQVHGRLREHYPALELVDLFKHPTLATLTDFLCRPDAGAQADSDEWSPLRPTTDQDTDVAVIGLSCRFPGAEDAAEFWDNLRQGRESIARFTVDELVASGFNREMVSDPAYVRASPVMKDAAGFDAAFFGYGAREAELMDPQQRLFLECAWEALEDAGYNSFQYPGRIGTFAGASMNTYFTNNVHPNRHRLDPQDRLEVFTLDSMGGFQAMVANDKDYIATRTSYKLDLRGPSVNIQTACSTGLVVIHAAVQSLLAGDCTMALAGAAAVQSPQAAGHLWQDGMLVSSDGHCRAFDADASGTIFGSGVGAVLLKPLKAALADGDHVYAVIKGTAVNNDGGVKVGFMAPSGAGETRVVRDALAAAAVPPETITYLEAHGTGTALGDPIEVSSLAQALRSPGSENGICALGSVKTNVGHLQIASGIVGFIKTVLALHHREIPPTLHFNRANPAIDLDNSPFRINTSLLPWHPPAGMPRRAGVNSLGIGGTNAHVILEEAPSAGPLPIAADDRPLHLLTLSARTPSALTALIQSYQRFAARHTGADPADLCFTANTGRKHFDHRCAITFDSLAALQTALDGAIGTRVGPRPRLTFQFGSDARPGLGNELFQTSTPFRTTLERCEAILHRTWPVSLTECLFDGAPWPDDPAFPRAVAASLGAGMAELWRSWGVNADHANGPMAGWAVGEQSLEVALAAVIANQTPDIPAIAQDALMLEMSAEGWQPLLESLGKLHVMGVAIDWFGFDRPYRRRRMPLPTYPFEHRRFWLEPPLTTAQSALETRSTPGSRPHPLLDRRFSSPLVPDIIYESRLDSRVMPLLADHLVHGDVVVSGACYISMLLGVGGGLGKASAGVEISEVAFLQRLAVPASGVAIQLGIRPDSVGNSTFTVISLPEGQDHRHHATGKLLPLPATAARPDPAKLVIDCPDPVDLDGHHRQLEARHITLGPRYRWMTMLSRGPGQAFCRLQRPDLLTAAENTAYGLHPGLIDSCFGLMMAAMDLEVEDSFLPSGIERLRFHASPKGETLWAWGRFARQVDGGGITGDITMCEEDGTPVLEITGLAGRLTRSGPIAATIPATAPVPLYRMAWEQAPLPAASGSTPKAWLIIADSAGIGQALAKRLGDRNIPCRCVTTGQPYDYPALLAEAGAMAGVGAMSDVGIMHLASLDIHSGTDPQTARNLGAGDALAASQAVIAADGTASLWLVTCGAQAIGDEPVQPLQSPVWGLGKVLRLEHPALPCRTIDLDPATHPEISADQLAAELAIAGQPEIAWRNGTRQQPVLVPVSPVLPVPMQPLALDPAAAYLVAGAPGALGAVLLDWLADHGACHIVTASRRGIVDDQQTARLAERGVTLHPLAADIADGPAFETAWLRLEARLPPLRGVFHAAGVLDDAAIPGLTPARLDIVSRPKMEGALTLARLADTHELDLFVLFSSAASILGNPGQANYAAANTFLDTLAADLRGRGIKALSIGWGPWSQSGMASAGRIASGFERVGIHALSANQGRLALEHALTSGLAHVCAITCDWDRYVVQSSNGSGDGSGRTDLFRHLVAAPPAMPTVSPASSLADALAKAGPQERQHQLFTLVLDSVTEALSFTGADEIIPDQPLKEQGLDSLAALGVRAALGEALGRSFPVALVFEHPTVEDLVRYLDRELSPPASSDDDLDDLDLDALQALVNRELDEC